MMVAVPAAGNRGVRAQAVPTLCIAKPDSGSCGPTGMGSREKRDGIVGTGSWAASHAPCHE